MLASFMLRQDKTGRHLNLFELKTLFNIVEAPFKIVDL